MKTTVTWGVSLFLCAAIGVVLCGGRIPAPPLLAIGAQSTRPARTAVAAMRKAVVSDFEAKIGLSLMEEDKTALVYCYAPVELKWDNEAVDHELANAVAYRFNANKIHVVDPDRVHAWLDKNKDWNKVSEVGAAFKVDYVVHIDLRDYSLFEEHSHDLYRGRAVAIISVIKMHEDKKDGKAIYMKEKMSRFPPKAGVSAYEFPYEDFKRRYLSELANEIGALFYESIADDDSPADTLQP